MYICEIYKKKTYTLEQLLFAAAILKVCESFLFGESKKIVVDLGLYESSLYFCVILYQVKTVYKRQI